MNTPLIVNYHQKNHRFPIKIKGSNFFDIYNACLFLNKIEVFLIDKNKDNELEIEIDTIEIDTKGIFLVYIFR
jgi:hypothetical protein